MKNNHSNGLGGHQIDRRKFLQVSGGITFFFSMGSTFSFAQRRGQDYPEDFNAYLRIHENGRVTCYTGKIEMGQGIITSLAQMLAEELDVALDTVDMVMGDTLLCPWDGGTTGSRSTKFFGPALRQAGANARNALLQMASDKLDAPASNLDVQNGVITDRTDKSKTISYAELAGGERIDRPMTAEIKPVGEHTISGREEKHADARIKVTGAAKYTGDIRLPGMLYACVLRPPAHGATLKSVNLDKVKQIPGIITINEPDLVAVLHELPDTAASTLPLVEAEWEIHESDLNNNTIFDHLLNTPSEKETVTEGGLLAAGKAASSQLFDEKYTNHYVAHAPMETHTVLVDASGIPVKVWVSSQVPFRVQQDVARTLTLAPDQVRVMTPFLGGGFGGKKSGIEITQAAQLSQLTKRPVQISLSRSEEFFLDAMRPAAVVLARSGIDTAGRITFWDFDHYYPGTRSSEPIYNIPHFRVLSNRAQGGDPHPFHTGAWRGPGSNTNVFAMESHTDVMAAAAGVDPLTFRLNNLADERMINVLRAAADQFGNPFAPGPSGKGYGIACTNYLNTYVATMAEVTVDEMTGRIKVNRIVSAQDMGEIINPQGARLQIEGGVTMGLGYCLYEEVEFNGGQVLTENFDTYEITRFSEAPVVEAVLVHNPGLAPQGCGEPAITTMGGVIANAVYDAIGVRIFTLPMTPDRIREAMK